MQNSPNYVGSKAIPHKVGEYTETHWYCVVDGRRIPCSDSTIAQKNVEYYQCQGKQANVASENVVLNAFEIW